MHTEGFLCVGLVPVYKQSFFVVFVKAADLGQTHANIYIYTFYV